MAQCYIQTKGADYDETFSPVVRMESLGMIVGLAAKCTLKLHQQDVTTAFLIGQLQKEIYMEQPDRFIAEGQEKLVCKLRPSIFGLKQSPRCWNTTLNAYMKKIGFLQSTGDPCVYIAALREMAVVGVYVDDIVMACKSGERLKQIKSCLCRRFSVKDLGKLHHFFGIRVLQDDIIWIGHPVYVDNLLKKLGMQDAKSVSTPVDTSIKLTKAVDGEEMFDKNIYQSAVGCLLLLSTSTRPDISFAVSNVAKYSSEPTQNTGQRRSEY